MKALIATDFDLDVLADHKLALDVQFGGWVARRIPYTPEELVAALNADRIEILVVEVEEVTAPVFQQCPSLAVVASLRANPVNVDLAAAREHGVVVLHTPGRNAQAVAELTIALILGRLRHVTHSHNDMLAGGWGEGEDDPYVRFRGRQLAGKTIGLLGLGAIGQRVARLLVGFDCTVLGYDPYLPDKTFAAAGVMPVGLDDLLERSDILSIHVSLDETTRGMLKEDHLRKMKPSAILVNTSRAAVVEQAALRLALRAGWIAGAALDVYDEEPPNPADPLLSMPQVISTPHIGGATYEVITTGSEIVAVDLARLQAGLQPLHAAAWPDVPRFWHLAG